MSKTTHGNILPHIDPDSLNYIIYHKNCPDGFGAAYSAWKKLGTKATYHAAEHYSPPPSDLDKKRVGIFDFSYPKSIIKELEKKAELVVIIDHHITAKLDIFSPSAADKIEDEKQKNYHFDMNKSGARLAWEFFWPDKPIPSMIKYIEDKDLYRFLLPKSREFSTYWETVPLEFAEYDKYVNDECQIEKIQEIGTHILMYRDTRIKNLLKEKPYKRKITLNLKEVGMVKTYHVSVVNSPAWISELGNKLVASEEEGCDFSLVWSYDGIKRRYTISLRSINEKTDVSQIAKHFGGGGHRNAAGFVWNDPNLETLFDKE